MYSLYRAWLLHHQDNAAFTTSTTPPPDVLLHVGPAATQFTAHRALLVAHSGYFKSVLLSQQQQSSPIIVTNIGVGEFTALLTWMYTGFLDLNLENIYNILLATHLLHMPSALEICRNFLIQNNHLLQPASENRRMLDTQHTTLYSHVLPNNIVKPIPSRKLLPSFPNPIPPPPPGFEPIQSSLQLNANTFQKIKKPEDDRSSPSSSTSSEKIIEVTSPKPSTSRRTPTPKTTTPVEEIVDNDDDTTVVSYTKKPPTQRKIKKSTSTTTTASSSSSENKVIIDIACCDGPVRFHRVLNNCYGLINQENVQQDEKDEFLNKTEIMNKIMTANINMKKSQQKGEDTPTDDAEIIYTCVYCNHTFKSQYCYQKHARRHINPITLNSTCKVAKECGGAPSGEDTPVDDGKREVKLLDMNVQYYPCKTCGSKFPSYYFVHKHRKMYHAEEMMQEKDQQPEVEKKSSSSTSSSSDVVKKPDDG